jgi:hypothetical protein
MTLIICLAILYLAGFLTVATESFTHFAIGGSFRESFREFLIQSALFAISAIFWAASVWIGMRYLGFTIDLFLLAEILGAAHLPLFAYPLTITPTLGYRLEQILRLSVYALFASALFVFANVPLLSAGIVCLPGWLFHFLTQEARTMQRVDSSR